MIRRIPSVALLTLALAAPSFADPAGFAFLEVPAGATASALGGAYASRAQGAEAAFWNPAGLAAVKGVQITASHYEFLQGLRLAQFAFAEKGMGGGYSASLRAMYSEPITERDVLGNEIGTFGAHDLEIAFGYGRDLSQTLALGGTAQIVRERIAESAATTYAFNVGGLWTPPALTHMRVSASLHNVGPGAAYDFDGAKGQNVPLPTALQLGASYDTPAAGLDFHESVETRLTRGRPGLGMIGVEGAHVSGAALRVGLRLNDDTTNLSFGLGYATSGLKLDYAFVPYRLDLGDTQRFSLSLQF